MTTGPFEDRTAAEVLPRYVGREAFEAIFRFHAAGQVRRALGVGVDGVDVGAADGSRPHPHALTSGASGSGISAEVSG